MQFRQPKVWIFQVFLLAFRMHFGHYQFSCPITWGSVMLMMRSTKPSCFVAWRTDTLYSPYFWTPLVLPSGQYWWHTSCGEENMVAGNAVHCSVNRTASNLSILHQVWQHHNHPTLSLIDHLPEVSTGGVHWSLGNDEPFPLFVALYSWEGDGMRGGEYVCVCKCVCAQY